MAAPICYQALQQISKVKYCSRLLYVLQLNTYNHKRHQSGAHGSPDPERLFARQEIRNQLMKITGFDLNKIFSEHFVKATTPKYQLLTDVELEQVQEQTVARARSKMQMPPVMNARSNKSVIISDDVEIDGHSQNKYVFTDITFGLRNKTRVIVLREPDGKLRHATGEERDRLLHIYYPTVGRKYQIPKIFSEQRLEELLQNGNHVEILNRACVQFEPDDQHFLRVTHRVYEYTADRNEYDLLRSTRFFGPMALYFTCHNRVEGLIVDMIQRDLLQQAVELVSLHNLIFTDTVSAQYLRENTTVSGQKTIEVFAENDVRDGGRIQLALQAYLEAKAPKTASEAV